MECVADRFVETTDGEVVDLATGERVLLTITSAGGDTDQRRWMIRCDLFQKLHHPVIANLLDYGLIGESRRFEAWRSSGSWCGADAAAASVSRVATSFFEACGLTMDEEGPGRVHRHGSLPIVIPAAAAGYRREASCANDGALLPLDHCGVLSVERRGVRAVAELFDLYSRQPQIVRICGARGSGKTTTAVQLARVARMQGYIPFSARLLDTLFVEALEGRSALIIDDDATGANGLLDVALRSPRRHILLTTSREATHGPSAITLRALPPATLAAAVLPTAMADAPRVRQAAIRANGVPGAFLELLHGTRVERLRRKPTASRAAEQTPAYGSEDAASPVYGRTAISAVRTTWPAPGELAALRRQMDAALVLLGAGRHAPGDRALRQAIGGMARRGIWSSAADGSLALAASLLKRGQLRDAVGVLDAARDYCKRTANAGAMLSVATLSGVALVDLGRLDEATSVLGAAAAAAAGDDINDDIHLAAGVELARSRCRFWRGEYADANDALRRFKETDLREPFIVRLHAMQARVAVGSGDLANAVAAAIEAQRRAATLGDSGLAAEAASAAAFTHLAVGDLPALQRDAAICVAIARAAHDPLRAFRIQIMLAEQLRRLGRRGDALDAVRRLNRASSASLPPILRLRRDMLADLLAGKPLAAVVARHVTGSGVPALALFLPREGSASLAASRMPTLWEDAIETLRLCQDAADERATLTAVCGHIQRQLHAVAVAFFGVERGALTRLAGNGGAVESPIALRAVAASVPIAPHRIEERTEAGAPVRYGGATIGALAVFTRSRASGRRDDRGDSSSRSHHRQRTGSTPAARAGASRRADGHSSCDARCPAIRGAGGGRAVRGADRGRKRERKGACRARNSSIGTPARSSVLHVELCRTARRAG